jgi:hypothetical protein
MSTKHDFKNIVVTKVSTKGEDTMGKQYVILANNIDLSGFKIGDLIEHDPESHDSSRFRKVNGDPVSGPYISIVSAVKEGTAIEVRQAAPKAPKAPKEPAVAKKTKDAVEWIFQSMSEGERCHMVNKLHKEGYLGTGPLASQACSR